LAVLCKLFLIKLMNDLNYKEIQYLSYYNILEMVQNNEFTRYLTILKIFDGVSIYLLE